MDIPRRLESDTLTMADQLGRLCKPVHGIVALRAFVTHFSRAQLVKVTLLRKLRSASTLEGREWVVQISNTWCLILGTKRTALLPFSLSATQDVSWFPALSYVRT